ADQYTVSVLSGAGFATSTQVLSGTADDAAWQTVTFNISSWAGQSIKLKAAQVTGQVGGDDAGLMAVTIPSWSVTGTTTLPTGGPTGKYARTNGNLTSSAFTLAADVQQLKLDYKGDGAGASFYLELLRGVDFSTVVDLAGNVAQDTTQWKTLK